MTLGDRHEHAHDGSPASADPGSDLRFSPRPNRAHEIAWQPWGHDAFDEARRAGKPVLLAISAVWCHWCHVMDETTYSDSRVLSAIAADYVAVRIDNDRRPDLNRRYNMGGWPTVAFLTASGEVLTGATYLPPDQFLTALERVRDYYAEHAAALLGAADERAVAGAASAPPADAPPADGPPAATVAPDASAAAAAVRAVAALYDPLYGGLGSEPKFPQPEAIGLLLTAGVRSGDERLVDMARHSLDAMAAGGLYDTVEGGFFRYATRRDWSTPHFEKLLDDNARLALLYLDAFAYTGHAAYAEVALGVVAYLTAVLAAPDAPVFFGSQDADEHYYACDAAGRRALAAPPVDRTVFVDSNALVVRALLRGAALLDRPDLLEAALAALDDLWQRGHGRHAMTHYLGGPIDGLLADQANMTAALLDAYEVSGERAYLARARLVADWSLERLQARDGRFTDRPQVSGEAPTGVRDAPLAVLEGGAELADCLIRLAAFSGAPTYRAQATRSLAAYRVAAAEAGPLSAAWALAVMRFAEHPAHIVIVGRRDDAQAGALLRAGLRIAEPLRSVQLLDPDADAETIAREGYAPGDEGAAAFVCLAGVCLAPTSDPARLAGLVAGTAAD
jgi:uncharacterized protein